MAKGFFRRIFSFGASPEENRARIEEAEAPAAAETPVGVPPEPAPVVAVEPAPPVVTEPPLERPAEQAVEPLREAPSDPLPNMPLASLEPISAASIPSPEPARIEERPAEPAPAAKARTPEEPEPGAAASEPSPAEVPTLLAEPAALPPAPSEEPTEPEDFSWLDAPLSPEGEEDRRQDPAPLQMSEPVPPIDTPDFLDQPLPPEDEVRPVTTEDNLAPPNLVPLDGTPDEADFSWLEQDLPPEEEDTAPVVGSGPAIDPVTGIRTTSGFELAPAPAPVAPVPFFQRLRTGLQRSSGQLSGQITSIFTQRKLDETTLQDFEDVLIKADLGVETAMRITDRLSEGRFGREISSAEVRRILAEEVEKALDPVAEPLELDLSQKPHVILVVGVNGTGKTTTIGKLAAKLTRGGLKVTLGAGDTFRAAAVEQLRIWGERTGSTVVARQIGADAAGLAYEAYDIAVENGSDVLIIDTAGRLQNRTELMAELEKIVRVLQKREPDAPHTVLQTLDATTGQNALTQVEIFRNVAGVNGLVMTKLDGTARGGILVAIAAKFRLPVFFVGVGEGIDDLEPFKARDFAEAIAGTAPAEV